MWPYNEDTKARYGKPQKKKGFAEAMHEIENNPYLRTKDEIDAGAIPLEGGVSGDTLMEDPSMNESAFEQAEQEPMEAPVVAEEKEEPPLLPMEKPAKKTNAKRKAEPPPAVGAATPAKQIKTLTPVIDTPPAHSTPSEEKTSRSGRVLKPKKFEDENEEARNEETVKLTPSKKSESPRKLWVEVAGTGDRVEIDLEKDKPSFESVEEEAKWDKQSASDAIKFKKNVESGKHIPPEVLTRIKSKSVKTPQEEEILLKEKEMSNRREKVHIFWHFYSKLITYLIFILLLETVLVRWTSYARGGHGTENVSSLH